MRQPSQTWCGDALTVHHHRAVALMVPASTVPPDSDALSLTRTSQAPGQASLARIRQWRHRECLDGISAALRSFKMPNAQGLGSSAAGERHNLLDQSTLNQ